MGGNALGFGQRRRGRYRVDLYHYDLTDAVAMPRERDLRGRLRPCTFYWARCAKCGKSVILQARNPEFVSPPVRLVRLDKCECGCWACGKPIDRGNPIAGSRRGAGQHKQILGFAATLVARRLIVSADLREKYVQLSVMLTVKHSASKQRIHDLGRVSFPCG